MNPQLFFNSFFLVTLTDFFKTKTRVLSAFILLGFAGFSQTTAIPDANFEKALINLGLDSGSVNGFVLTANIVNITSLNVHSKGIRDLTGIEAFTSLTYLSCWGNQLTSLDLSSNTALTNLSCFLNQLTHLDVSNNTRLTYLSCAANQLTNLDVSLNVALTSLDCSENRLTSLNLKNGKNSLLTYFIVTNNPNLTCIEVDDSNYSTDNWYSEGNANFNQDAIALFREDCNNPPIDINLTSNTIVENAGDNAVIGQLSTIGSDSKSFTYTMEEGLSSLFNIDGSNLRATSSFDYETTKSHQVKIRTNDGDNNFEKTFTIIVNDMDEPQTLTNKDFKISSISIYPNPTANILNITTVEKVNYRLLNISGQTIKEGNLVKGKNTVNVLSLAKGIYLLNIKTSKRSFTKKIIKN